MLTSANALAFMNSNIVISTEGMPEGKRYAFQLVPRPGAVGHNRAGMVIPVLNLKVILASINDPAPVAVGAQFVAYWCPYQDNQTGKVMVENAADLMFTVNMDGCSLGVGSATLTGGHRVGHVNKVNAGAGQEGAQKVALIEQNLDDQVLGRSNYMDGMRDFYGATTFGIRTPGNNPLWAFYSQRITAKTHQSFVLWDVLGSDAFDSGWRI